MIEFLGLKNSGHEFKECPPRWFYKYSVTYDNHITLMLTQKEDYTAACVNISGQGCRLIESFSCYSLLDLIKRVALLYDFNMSRIDIAQDIIDEKFNIDKLVKAYKKGNYTCRSKFSNLMQSIDDGIEGTSLYFGKKGSNCFINIYDKRAERGFIPEDMPNWTRIEIRLRAENATAPYWKKILQHSEKVSVFESVGVEYNYSKFENYLFNTCGSSIMTYLLTHTKEELVDELLKRNIKLNQHQQFLVDNYMQDVDFYVIE